MSPPADKPDFLSFSIRWDGLIDTALLVGLSLSWIGLLGEHHWVADLFSHFRLQAAAASAGVLLWAWWRKRRLLRLGALATLALNAGLVGVTMTGVPPANADKGAGRPAAQAAAPEETESGNPAPRAAGRSGLTVVSLNVLTSNPNHTAVLAWLESCDADVIFLMEVDTAWQNALRPLLARYPHHLFDPRSNNFGLAFLSRLPLESLRLLTPQDLLLPDDPPVEDLIMNSVEARLTVAGQALTLYGTHPVPPSGKAYAAARDLQLKALERKAALQPRPVLLVGDLNTTPWSHGMRLLTGSGRLRLHRSAWQPTWNLRSPLAIPIDHVLAMAPLRIAGRRIGPDVGSDHRGQLVRVDWAGADEPAAMRPVTPESGTHERFDFNPH